MSTFLEDLGRHIAWSAAGGSQHVKLLLVHDTRQAKIGNEQVCIVLWRSEQ